MVITACHNTCVATGAARVNGHVKLSLAAAHTSGQVHAVDVAVVALAEDDAVEGLVELNGDLHEVLLTLDVEAGDLGHVGLCSGPSIVLGLGRLDVCWCRVGGLGVVLLLGWPGGWVVLWWLRLPGWLGLGLVCGLGLGPVGGLGLGLVGGLGLLGGRWAVGRLLRRRTRLGGVLGRLGLGSLVGLLLGRWWPRLVLGWLRLGSLGLWLVLLLLRGRGTARGRRRPVGGLLLGRGPVGGLGGRWPVLGTSGDHNATGLHLQGERHRDGACGPRLLLLLRGRVVLGLGRGLGGAIRVDGGSLGGAVLLLGHRGGGGGSLRGVVAVSSTSCWGRVLDMVAAVVTSVSASVPVLCKDLLRELALLGQLVLDVLGVTVVYPVISGGEAGIVRHTDSLYYGDGLLLLGAHLQGGVVTPVGEALVEGGQEQGGRVFCIREPIVTCSALPLMCSV